MSSSPRNADHALPKRCSHGFGPARPKFCGAWNASLACPFQGERHFGCSTGGAAPLCPALPPSTMVQAFGLTAVRGQRETVVTGKLSLAWKWHLLPAPHTAVFAEYLQPRRLGMRGSVAHPSTSTNVCKLQTCRLCRHFQFKAF